MWSSAVFEPWIAVRAAYQLESGWPSTWTANHIASFAVVWLLYMIADLVAAKGEDGRVVVDRHVRRRRR